ncbi:protease YdgD [Azospirillaceae bacterium]
MVPLAGVEPARCYQQQILSLPRLPVPPQRLIHRQRRGVYRLIFLRSSFLLKVFAKNIDGGRFFWPVSVLRCLGFEFVKRLLLKKIYDSEGFFCLSCFIGFDVAGRIFGLSCQGCVGCLKSLSCFASTEIVFMETLGDVSAMVCISRHVDEAIMRWLEEGGKTIRVLSLSVALSVVLFLCGVGVIGKACATEVSERRVAAPFVLPPPTTPQSVVSPSDVPPSTVPQFPTSVAVAQSPTPKVVLPLPPVMAAGAAGERIVVNAMEYPWSAIGRLNAAGRGYCTAFLVGERYVLTAAHCFYDRVANRWRPPSIMHFVAGYQRGQAVVHAAVVRYVTADDYQFALHPTVSGSTNDWALAELAEPLGRTAGWLGVSALTPTVVSDLRNRHALVLLAGYRSDAAHTLTVQSGCELHGMMVNTQTAVHTCEAVKGDSGGPLLTFDGHDLKVIGIHVVAIDGKTAHYGGAVATSVLTDVRRWPKAAGAIEASGILSGLGTAPPGDGPVFAQPRQTVGELLARRGFPVAVDGMSGAVRRFQQARQLPVTGDVSVQSLGYLLQK